jgi:polysaccharide chain length determinant protein (PEP-CTERM system associated)
MENSIELEKYLAIAKRRFWYAVIPFVVVLSLSIGVVESLPPVYRATATIAVESQQIPEDFVQSTVVGYADERIGFVEQRVMTTDRLLGIIDEFLLFPDLRGEKPDSVLVDELRDNILIERIRDHTINRRSASSTVAFTVSFDHRDAITAAAVADRLAKMFLEENVRSRTNRATETTQFLRREAEILEGQVAAMDARVAAYKQEHSHALPEHLDMRMNMLQTSENSLRDLEREIAALEENRRLLETQRTTVGAILRAGTSGMATVLSPAQQLETLKVELSQKSAIYTPAHPDVRNLKRRIAQLERQVAEEARKSASQQISSAADPARVEIESRIASVDVQLKSLRSQKTELQEKIAELQARIVETPQVERGLKDLTRDYETALAEYEEIVQKKRAAELAENLEAQEKAERFVLLEPPKVPSLPAWPEKLKLYAIAFALAVGSGVATATIAESLDTTIRGSSALGAILQRHPLAVIPVIESSVDRRRKRSGNPLLLGGAVLVVLVGLVIFHFFVQPLDELLSLFP